MLGRERAGATAPGALDPSRTAKFSVLTLAAADPCPGLSAHTLKSSWPHFLQLWEAAGMRKTQGTHREEVGLPRPSPSAPAALLSCSLQLKRSAVSVFHLPFVHL